jgi:hypothetical protein
MLARFFPRRPSLVVLSFACAAGVVSCADSATPRDREGQLSQELFANDQTIYDYFVGKGLTSFQAAGIVGNLDQESGGDPMAMQSGGPGRGIAQWSVGGRWDTDAGDNATAYASQQGQSVWSLQLQLDFIWFELTNFSGYGLASLKASTNVTDATVAFQDKFEGCGTCDQTNRVSYAMAVLAAYGASAPSYAAKFVSQTYPYASVGPVMLTVGQTVTGSIVMQNTGTKPWLAGVTKLAPIPRDQASPFQSPSWLTNARVSTVAQDVPPGSNGTFEWDLTGSAPGDFSPFFGFVEEGVTWFADGPDGGGPPDNDVQVHIVVSPAQGMGTGGSDAGGTGGTGTGATGGTGAAGAGDSGAGGEAGATSSGGKGGTSSTGTGGTSAKGGSSSTGGNGGESSGGKGGGAAGTKSGGGGANGGTSAATAGTAGKATGGGSAGKAGGGSDLTVVDDGDSSSSGGCEVVSGARTSGWWISGLAPLLALGLRRVRRRSSHLSRG